jgi:hypothetical protein
MAIDEAVKRASNADPDQANRSGEPEALGTGGSKRPMSLIGGQEGALSPGCEPGCEPAQLRARAPHAHARRARIATKRHIDGAPSA